MLILLPLLISAIAEDTYYEYIFSFEEEDTPTTPPHTHTTLSARNQIPSVSTSQYNVLATAYQKIVFQNKTTFVIFLINKTRTSRDDINGESDWWFGLPLGKEGEAPYS